MKLTGKAKEEFKKWFDENYNDFWNYYNAKKTLLNALIIEWFDSVEIYIEISAINYVGLEFSYNIQEKNTINGSNGYVFKIRNEATDKAIAKANEIYNKKI